MLSFKNQELKGVQSNSEKLLILLKKNKGKLNLWDKSSPQEIEEQTQMSKSAFKKAVGILYKNREINLGQGYIELKKRKVIMIEEKN